MSEEISGKSNTESVEAQATTSDLKQPPESTDEKDVKPFIETKSSMEILSELFETFDAQPPVIVKKEKDEPKKAKKSKKKHKHKDKKHKKKTKKKSKSNASESSNSSGDDEAIDLSDILIKKEKSGDQTALAETLSKIITIKTELPILDSLKAQDQIKSEENDVKPTKKTLKESQSKSSDKSLKTKSEHKHKKRKRSREKEHVSESKRLKSSAKTKERVKKKSSKKTTPEKSSSKVMEEIHKCHRRHSSIDLRNKLDHFREHKSEYHDSERDRDKSYKDSSSRHKDDHRRHHSRDEFYKGRSSNDRSSFRSRKRSHSREHDTDFIDKKKLLEIARRNAIQMMKSGSLPAALTLGPQAREKVIHAIKSGGKTIAELTDFCKTLSRKEELGELSSVSEDSDDPSQPFHHPFIVKDRPLIINIKNAVPLPTKTNQERTTELRLQFPVSSGQQHRKTEGEWTPVQPKKTAETVKTVALIENPNKKTEEKSTKITVETASTTTNNGVQSTSSIPGPQAFPPSAAEGVDENVDIASVVSQRLQAIRKLRENPNDSQAIGEMYRAQKEMNEWAESKQQVGQFTGSTGVQLLTQAELSSGYQAWARKDQLVKAAPVSSGMGMHLLQKMGWKPGEGLGKDKSGALEPLMLEVKLDKKGIVAQEENKKKPVRNVPKATVKTLEGKHPVSLLGEYASKRKLGAPEYIIEFECGPDHKKNFLFKVILAGVEYKPNVASGNKKEAKAIAARVCLQALGLIPS